MKEVEAKDIQNVILEELLEFLEEVSDVASRLAGNKIAEMIEGKTEKPWSIVKFIKRTIASIDHLKKLAQTMFKPRKFKQHTHIDCQELLKDIDKSIETIKRYHATALEPQKTELATYLEQITLRRTTVIRLYEIKIGKSLI